ncbi:dephospho-CoA kinase [Psychrobacter sp. I-STPA10]|uniref:dephospho-CoA kinase n=1 Tax=Psychrobacter sp. I-STPA10 TaxID=2585769 RepID=UPI001E4A5D41|nr:dephospho-CoA kinase [Psychrobacter sp. I-STPA10]
MPTFSDTTTEQAPQVFNKPQQKRLVIGVTGGIGSGKSVVTKWFEQQGIEVVDADDIAHQIMQKGSPTLAKLVTKFGNWILTEKGEMDRKAVRQHVFTYPDALMTLESITHPAIRLEAKRRLAQTKSTYVILSAPLLLEGAEAGLANLCHRILVIDAPESLQIERASKRDKQTIEKIKAIMDNQLSREDRTNQADDIVINDGDLNNLYAQLQPLHKNYLSMANMPLSMFALC